MKKAASMIVCLLLVATIAVAQRDSAKFIQKISGGLITGISGCATFQGAEKPFSMGYGLLGNITFVTPKTYHNFMYGFPDNSFRFLSGYFFKRKWDTYFVYSKVLTLNQNYLGLGIEKMVKAGDVSCF
jgi:hypothetical protein